MNRHFWRACDRGAGFSFVELLVTIVIAGIAFAALVPVFVQANQENAADNVRVQSTQVAQDKLEKVRQLAYGTITTANLNSSTFADAQFGPTESLSSGSGTRVINLQYTVTPYPDSTTGLQSEYKIVTVDAYWDAPPSPVKHTVLSTIVYRQYSGPMITSMTLTPPIGEDGVLGDDTLSSVLIKAHVDLSTGADPEYLQFTITGSSPASQKVLATDTDSTGDYWYDPDAGNFYWRWDCSDAVNGTYDIFASAFSSDGYVGNTFHLYPIIDHVIPVAAPAAVTATAGDATVAVTWVASTESTTSNYAVYRSTLSTGPWDSTTLLATVDSATTTYTDSTAVNGTTYYYAVRTLTSDSRASDATVSNSATPAKSTDDTAPTAPTSLVASAVSGTSTIQLTWTASTDLGSPATGVQYYEIWRSADGTDWGTSAIDTSATSTYSDASAGYDATWYYKVRAVDGALNVSSFSGTVSATSDAFPHHDLKISVKSGNNACYVWVLYASSGQTFTGHYFNTSGSDIGASPGTGTHIAKNSSVTFTNVPDGSYTIYSNSGSTFSTSTNKTWGKTVSGADAELTGVTP